MKRNVKKAINALKKINAPVYDHLAGEYGAYFVIGAELRDCDDVYFCDYYHEEIRESVVDGKVINAFGIRQDVHEILDANGLYAEWINAGQVGVYTI